MVDRVGPLLSGLVNYADDIRFVLCYMFIVSIFFWFIVWTLVATLRFFCDLYIKFAYIYVFNNAENFATATCF